jgi:transcriptional regulator with XRE-family HTH domain
MAVPQGGGPTAPRIVLGAQLRRLREARGITREAAGDAIRGSASKISRLELGRVSFKDRDVADLLTLYGVLDEQERSGLLGLARDASASGWWHQYGNVMPGWFEVYVGLEEAASRIRTYEVQFVPGLFQTEDYARAVIRLGRPEAPADEIEHRVSLRMRRQQILTRPESPKMWAVVDETALRRPLGGPDVMRAQMAHLIEITRLPNVTLHVVPFHVGGHAAEGGSFTILRFSEPDLPDMVYLEQLTSALYLDKREDIDHYTAVMDRLCVQAEPRAATPGILAQILSDLQLAG